MLIWRTKEFLKSDRCEARNPRETKKSPGPITSIDLLASKEFFGLRTGAFDGLTDGSRAAVGCGTLGGLPELIGPNRRLSDAVGLTPRSTGIAAAGATDTEPVGAGTTGALGRGEAAVIGDMLPVAVVTGVGEELSLLIIALAGILGIALLPSVGSHSPSASPELLALALCPAAY